MENKNCLSTEKTWNELSGELRRFIKKEVKNETDTEDLLQEVFIKVHLKADTINDLSKTRAWVYQVTRNTIHDFWRRKKHFSQIEDIPAIAEKSNVYNRLLDCLPGLMEKLPTKYNLAILKADIEGVSQADLAKTLKISYSGVKSRVQRARIILSGYIKDCCSITTDRMGRVSSLEPKTNCSCSTC